MRVTSMLIATGVLLSLAPAATAEPVVRIHDIQGTTRVSPLDGQQVTGVPGVVTGIRAQGSVRGFWFQDAEPDGDPRTSEGLFVFTGQQTPAVKVGDVVAVDGKVTEYYPIASGETPETTPNQSVTELVGATWQVTGTGEVPPAEVVGPDAVPTEYAPLDGNIDKRDLEPQSYALDYYESRESMLLRVDDARVVGPTDAYRALWITSKPDQNANSRGGTTYPGYADPNAGRLKVESLADSPFPAANVGDRLNGTTEGPLDYSRFGGYVLEATRLGEHQPGGLQPESTRRQREDELAVATYNVENLAAGNDQSKFDRLAKGVVEHLASPDVVALEEVQDNNGPIDDGVVAADKTLQQFTDAIAAAGGPRYEWRLIDPQNNADGGQPGGNIRVAFLFNPARVSFVDRPGGDATTPVHPVAQGNGVGLTASPGRIDPANEAWKDSRKPLAGEFSFRGRTVVVVANHFNSKGGDQPLHGRLQPPERVAELQREKQAQAVRGFVDEARAIDGQAQVVVLGDLNDYGFSPAVQHLTEGGALAPLAEALPPLERYSYVYEGNSQQLDHILATPPLKADYDVVHINAEFADQTSDHDPQIARFTLR
ncbi:endonuclease/exonuclease/phosphatase family protein [Saccharopolyspora sp. WRP15-2]|uniref:Endonuclease/exonuclease/phosphatase family protein n=2 Tax=Saccharopolyspora oryzae TaxID=2997343 RepID=A0ABT4V8J2_9PSEU|nr:endonuclease/exonuclease/phosphatase family protein [Saccharopolyspora oryzae]MDA3630248.1 endonuclease/exonuclease/phosphatase family protein [Saccharopolyspora oryzae]